MKPIFTEAIRHWWSAKKKNVDASDASQGGTRSANLAGDTMDGFRNIIISKLLEAGVAREDIFAGGNITALPANLPFYFRASKNWDVIVCKNSFFKRTALQAGQQTKDPQLILAIEFKSQHGSIGNNQNNRLEESIGNAADFWASYENKNFCMLQPRPWLGYVFVGVHDELSIDKPVEIKQPHFISDPAFDGANPQDRLLKTKYFGPSYAHRYRIFLERMLAKKYYDGACFVTTHELLREANLNHSCPFPELSGDRFVDLMLRHVRAYYFD